MGKIISVGKMLRFENPISSSVLSNRIDLENYDARFAMQLNWSDGVDLDATASIEASLDGQNYSQLPTEIAITGANGSHIWDMTDTSVEYVRVKITINAGSANFSGKLNGKQRI